MNGKPRSLLAIEDLSVEEIDGLLRTALDIIDRPAAYADVCRGKKLATLFFEPSTRTRLSFEAAMYELGGNVLSVANAASSSASKGESVADTARVVSCYADIIAMRHPKEGAPLVAAAHASVPVINAGDGGHNHPTQTLADLLTELFAAPVAQRPFDHFPGRSGADQMMFQQNLPVPVHPFGQVALHVVMSDQGHALSVFHNHYNNTLRRKGTKSSAETERSRSKIPEDYLKYLLRHTKCGLCSEILLYCNPAPPSNGSTTPPASLRMISPAAVSHS